MLELFSAGLVASWLQMMGLPRSADPWDLVNRPSLQTAAWQVNAVDPAAERVKTQYLDLLKSQGLDPNSQGIWIQSGANLLTSHQGTVPMSAASLTKIATSLAALQTWGVNHQFETLVMTNGQIQNGVVQGDLLIQSNGDPMFLAEDAIALGNTLNKMGITRVTGDLVLTSRLMLHFEKDDWKSAELLKKILTNQKDWELEVDQEVATIPEKMTRPKLAIAGKVRSSAPIENATILVRHRSLPLHHLLKKLNVYSQNRMSQLLADHLGGTEAVIQKAATAARIPTDELLLINGSGLGTENRISAHAACAMLAAIDRYLHPLNLTIADVFPASGFDRNGTMEDRDMPARSVIKTGTLSTVSALAGVVPTRDRGLVWFAIINRGTDILELRQQQDLFLHALQREWGMVRSAAAIEPSAWVKQQRSVLDASKRNEIVNGG